MIKAELKRAFSKGWVTHLRNTYLANDSLALRLTRNVSWSIAGGVISSASTLLASILVARLLGAEQYGSLGIIQSSLSLFIVFAGASLGSTATKYIAELRESNPERAGRILSLNNTVAWILSTIMSLALLIGAPALAKKVLVSPQLAPHLRMATLALFLYGINGAQTGALAGFEAFKSIAKINLLRGAFTFPLMWLGTRYFGLMGTVASLGVVAAFGCSISALALRREARQAKFSFARSGILSEAKLLLTFSLPMTLTMVVFYAANWISNILLIRQPNGYVEMGIFNAATQWRQAILFLPIVMTQPFLSVLASLAGKGASEQYRKALRLSLVATTVSAFFPAIVVAVSSAAIMKTYGPAFRAGASTLVLLTIATVLNVPGNAIGSALMAVGRAWNSFGLVMFWSIIFIISFLFLKTLGAYGLAWAHLISFLLQCLIGLVIAARLFKIGSFPHFSQKRGLGR